MAKKILHILLGAGGAAGTPLAEELLRAGRRVRTVSRTGKGPEGAERKAADITAAAAVLDVVEEGSTVYLLAGLPYDRRIWRDQWPVIMRNAVAACGARSARLVFLDNVYLYGTVDSPMTETTPVNPCSVKGRIRAQIAGFLHEEMAAGRVTALIARAADFYGPFSEKSGIPTMLVLRRMADGKVPQVLARADTRHSYTYTHDMGKALMMLGESEDCWNQVWHLPAAGPAPTGRQFVEMAASVLGREPSLSVVPPLFMAAAGLVSTQMREVAEMLYQNSGDYLFDSSKFERRFSFSPTPYAEGIAATLKGFGAKR